MLRRMRKCMSYHPINYQGYYGSLCRNERVSTEKGHAYSPSDLIKQDSRNTYSSTQLIWKVRGSFSWRVNSISVGRHGQHKSCLERSETPSTYAKSYGSLLSTAAPPSPKSVQDPAVSVVPGPGRALYCTERQPFYEHSAMLNSICHRVYHI